MADAPPTPPPASKDAVAGSESTESDATTEKRVKSPRPLSQVTSGIPLGRSKGVVAFVQPMIYRAIDENAEKHAAKNSYFLTLLMPAVDHLKESLASYRSTVASRRASFSYDEDAKKDLGVESAIEEYAIKYFELANSYLKHQEPRPKAVAAVPSGGCGCMGGGTTVLQQDPFEFRFICLAEEIHQWAKVLDSGCLSAADAALTLSFGAIGLSMQSAGFDGSGSLPISPLGLMKSAACQPVGDPTIDDSLNMVRRAFESSLIKLRKTGLPCTVMLWAGIDGDTVRRARYPVEAMAKGFRQVLEEEFIHQKEADLGEEHQKLSDEALQNERIDKISKEKDELWIAQAEKDVQNADSVKKNAVKIGISLSKSSPGRASIVLFGMESNLKLNIDVDEDEVSAKVIEKLWVSGWSVSEINKAAVNAGKAIGKVGKTQLDKGNFAYLALVDRVIEREHLAHMEAMKAFDTQMKEREAAIERGEFSLQEDWRAKPKMLLPIREGSGGLGDKPDLCGRTPLWWACSFGHEHVARRLLECNYDPNPIDQMELDTPLHLAAKQGKHVLVNDLLTYRANVSGKNNKLRTALHVCCLKGKTLNYIKVAKALIDGGISVNAPDDSKRTVLHCSALIGNHRMLELLVEDGKGSLDSTDDNNDTALSIAVKSMSIKAAATLLLHGAKVDPRSSWIDGEITPLHVAALQGNVNMVKLLVDVGSADTGALSRHGYSPCHYACRAAFASTFGDDAGKTIEKGCSPREVLAFLFSRGADPAASSLQNHSLFYALVGGIEANHAKDSEKAAPTSTATATGADTQTNTHIEAATVHALADAAHNSDAQAIAESYMLAKSANGDKFSISDMQSDDDRIKSYEKELNSTIAGQCGFICLTAGTSIDVTDNENRTALGWSIRNNEGVDSQSVVEIAEAAALLAEQSGAEGSSSAVIAKKAAQDSLLSLEVDKETDGPSTKLIRLLMRYKRVEMAVNRRKERLKKELIWIDKLEKNIPDSLKPKTKSAAEKSEDKGKGKGKGDSSPFQLKAPRRWPSPVIGRI